MEVAEEERAKEIILSGVRLNTYSYHTHNKETTPPRTRVYCIHYQDRKKAENKSLRTYRIMHICSLKTEGAPASVSLCSNCGLQPRPSADTPACSKSLMQTSISSLWGPLLHNCIANIPPHCRSCRQLPRNASVHSHN